MFKRIIKKPFILVKSLQKSETCTLIGSLTKPNCFNQGSIDKTNLKFNKKSS